MSTRVPLAVVMLLCMGAGPAFAADYYTVKVIDDVDGLPVPGVTLTTTHKVVYTTDADGLVAFYEPGLMGEKVWFTTYKEGYSLKDWLGLEGKALQVSSGGTGTITLHVEDAGPVEPSSDDEQSRMLAAGLPGPEELFQITVTDAETGRGVPLVELRSPSRSFWTDSNGVVAYYEIDWMGEAVDFEVLAHGYDFPAGSVSFDVQAGGAAELQVERVNTAERLYRVTGGGIYADSVRLGMDTPLAEPLLSGLVMGQDTVFAIPYRGELFWIWGDTNRPSYPLGNFYVSGATSLLPEDGGLDPSEGVDLSYFVDENGFSKQMAPKTTVPGDGVCWISALTVLEDEEGEERLYAYFGKFLQDFTKTRHGLIVFDDDSELFEEVLEYEADARYPVGQSMPWTVDGQDWIYYNGLRIEASVEAMEDPSSYQGFTAIQEGSGELEWDQDGRLVYGWREADLIPADWVQLGLIPPDQALYGHVTEMETGQKPVVAAFAVAPNEHRRRFVNVILESWGSPSFLGEIWFTEADTPMGPWVYSRKVVTHDGYSFYNTRLHPYFDQDGGRLIYFEGTYTSWLTSITPTPRYNYNQIMYRLDLDDEGVVLPVPVYVLGDAERPETFVTREGLRVDHEDPPIVFFAPDRPGGLETRPVSWSGPSCRDRQLVLGEQPEGEVLFYALPPDTADPPAGAVELFEYVEESTQERIYSVDDLQLEGYTRQDDALALVWVNPQDIRFPVTDYLWPAIADAGADQCVQENYLGEGKEVTLDSSRSSARGSEIVSWEWSWSEGSSEGASPVVTLPAGVNTVRLVVTTARGETSTDTVLVAVDEGDELPPGDSGLGDDSGSPAPDVEEGCGGCGGPSGAGGLVLLALGLCGVRLRAG